MPYVMYLRKSRADIEAEQHGEGETLARHEKILTDLACRLKLNVTAIYREVVSGESISARPEVQRILREVEAGMWEGVLVVEVERLARGDTMDQGQVAKSFKMNNTKIITPMKIYDPSNEFDEEYFEFGLFMSRREYKTINRRLQRGRLASVNEGKAIFSVAPYGYRKVKLSNDKGYTLEIIPEEAEIVKLIFSLYTQGEEDINGNLEKLGLQSICRRLDFLQLKPRSGKLWSRSSIRDMLSNPTYLGKIRWQWKKETKVIENGIIKKKRVKSTDYMLQDGLHPALIDQETFDKAQIMLKRNRKSGITSTQLKNPLSGIVYCKKCGYIMTRLAKNSKTPYDTIKCSNRYCDNVSAPLYLVESELIKGLKEWLNNFSFQWDKSLINKNIDNISLLNESIKQSTNNLNELRTQYNRTFEFLEKGIYTTEMFMQRSAALSNQIEETELNLSNLLKELSTEEKRQSARKELIPNIKDLIDVYSSLSISQKNNALKNIVDKVEYVKYVKNTRSQRNLVNFELEIFPNIQ